METKFFLLIFILFDFVFATSSAAQSKKRKDFDFSVDVAKYTKSGSAGANEVACDSAGLDISITSGGLTKDTNGSFIMDNNHIICDFDSTIFKDFGDLRDDFVWNPKAEAEWTRSDLEIRQYLSIKSDEGANYTAQHLSDFDNSRFRFESYWPHLPQTPPTSKLSRFFHECALRWFLAPGHLEQFRRLCRCQLIDLTFPIYDALKGVHLSFLSLAVAANVFLDEARFDELLEYLPKSMLDHPDSEGILPLTMAICGNRLDLVKKLVEAGADINKIIPNTLTPVMEAVAHNLWDIVDYFISTGKLDPNIVLNQVMSVLVVYCTHTPAFDLSHFHKIVNGPQKLNPYVLTNALIHLYFNRIPIYRDAITALITGNNPNSRFVEVYFAFLATSECDFGLFKFLEMLNVPLFKLTLNGMTIIHAASELGLLDAIKFLVQDLGANINELTQDDHRLSVIQLAYNYNHFALVCELIKLGATAGIDDVVKRAIVSNNQQLIISLREMKIIL